MSKKLKHILAIETSCDETAAAVVSTDFKILSNLVYSQIPLHQKTQGVVPEVASREHVLKIIPIISQALEKAKIQLSQIDSLAVTVKPGLVGSLLIGAETAKAMGWALKIPVIPVNHLYGHLVSPLADPRLKPAKIQFPILALTASGGHTQLVLMEGWHNLQILGQTQDDAAGEAFDKISSLLGLGYPGGPELERLANRSKGRNPISFPSPRLKQHDLDFSFSGLKTAVLYYLRDHPQSPKAQIAQAAQRAIIKALLEKTYLAFLRYRPKTVFIAGGVAANRTLQKTAKARFRDIQLYFPPADLLGDNAAMIGLAAVLTLNSYLRSL
jgi:N6-L-threonylcarbamoyladenine synthase